MRLHLVLHAGWVILGALQAPDVMAQSNTGATAPPPVLLAAGSLRQAMGEILAAYRAGGGQQFSAAYGPSGKLRKDIEGGRAVDVFASASGEHTEALARQGLLGASSIFTHNALCVVSAPAFKLRPENLLAELARPTLRLATSTPGSDPMGDYTWQFFRKAEQQQPGLYAILDAKALRLSGTAELAPESTLPYVTAFEQDKADAYIMYCTNAVLTKQAVPRLEILRIPDELNVRSAYGIGARRGSAEGERLLRFVLGPAGQAILRQHGFH
ncbi:extracellular solute-binding protein [Massilia sp. IC2-476]|uniref:extracellular solute-binding protein n=1 Tax=Massilia sp. IC2-476 TaxID=2887199 RepID=UPI001D110F95|nr:extracellular solute-binding protein [Massilia sp. IC2-476]MCC2970413.1 extracellular solute-binding protein [Massilia sp. IC2-476]